MARDIKHLAQRVSAQAAERRRNLRPVAVEARKEAEELARAAREGSDALKQREQDREAVRPLLNIPGFFPTPPHLASYLCECAALEAGMLCLEPEAGKADIADIALKVCPGIIIECCEIQSALREILRRKGYTLRSADFFELDPTAGPYDRILMNPPFEHGQDAKHIQHAYGFLKRGTGRLVSVISPSPFYHSARWARGFREWLDGVDYELLDLPRGVFLNGERSTGVNTKLIIIDC
jgi:hypothetical protein